MLYFVGLGALMVLVGHRRESAHVGEHNGDVFSLTSEIELIRGEQFVDDVGRDQFGKDVFNAAFFLLLENDLVTDQRDMG